MGYHCLDWSVGGNDELLALWSALQASLKKAVLAEVRVRVAILILVLIYLRSIKLANISAHCCWFLLQISSPAAASWLLPSRRCLSSGSSSASAILYAFALVLCCICCDYARSDSNALQTWVSEGISPVDNWCSLHSCCICNATGYKPVKRHTPIFMWKPGRFLCLHSSCFWLAGSLQGPETHKAMWCPKPPG